MTGNTRYGTTVRGIARIAALLLIIPWLVAQPAAEHFSWKDPLRDGLINRAVGRTASRIENQRTIIDRIEKSLAIRFPTDEYLMVDSRSNTLYLKRGGSTLLESLVSCGSGDTLEDPESGRTWVFNTPRGFFKITSKMVDPDWIKPDWAFIEEGEPVPDDPSQRFESGALGDYALGFGNGYFIHGTLYTTLLGKSVSHGCIRMGEDDLETLFASVDIGTPVFIY